MLRRLLPAFVGLVIVLLLTLLRVGDPFPVQVAREIGFDFYQRLHPRARRRPAGAGGRYRRGLARRARPVAVAARPAGDASPTGWPNWARRQSASTSCSPSPTACRRSGSPRTARRRCRDASRLRRDLCRRAGPDPLDPRLLAHPGRTAAAGAAKGGFAVSGPRPERVDPLPHRRRRAAADSSATRRPGSAASASTPSCRPAPCGALPLLWTNGSTLFPTLSLEALRIALRAVGASWCSATPPRRAMSRASGWAISPSPPPRAATSGSTTAAPIPSTVDLGQGPARPQYRAAARPDRRPHRADRHLGHRACSTCTTRRWATTCPASPSTRRPSSRSSRAAFLTRPDWVQGLEMVRLPACSARCWCWWC